MRACLFAVVASALAVACTPSEDVGRARLELAQPGPWSIPPDTLALGDLHHIDYVGAGPWIGEEGCSGGITPGTDILRDYLYAHFGQTDTIGGYACRPIVGNESQMSVHGTGRALDIMLPLDGGEADNDLGDPIGNWLIENAGAIGIQYIIWDLYTWMAERAEGQKGKDYGGAHPHHDHLHVEVSVDVAGNTENWFEETVDPPAIDGCVPLPFAGGVLEETDDCFVAFGPASYWRSVADDGHGGTLLWTNAFEDPNPSNWARWNIIVSSRGSYHVEVYVDSDWGVHRETRYGIKHAEGEAEVVIDQSAAQGWVSLGEFVFDPGGDQHVSVYDNAASPVAEEQHIAVDALQLTRKGGAPLPWDPGASDDEGGALPEAEDGGGGCAVASGRPQFDLWLFALSSTLFLGRACRSRRRPRRG